MNNLEKASRSQRKGAREILRLGEKALAYRRDILTQDQVEKLEVSVFELSRVLKSKPVLINELEEKAEAVDNQLKESGGLYYHRKGWVENVEMLMVAAIVVIGIRSFFLQPFIIPTNSMYPSFLVCSQNYILMKPKPQAFWSEVWIRFCLVLHITNWNSRIQAIFI